MKSGSTCSQSAGNILRKSKRTSSKKLKTVHLDNVIQRLLLDKDDGVELRNVKGRGRSVFATRDFQRDEFVMECTGELLTLKIAKEKEEAYTKTGNKKCFMFYFRHHERSYCIDSTKETDRLGRLVSHSRKSANVKPKIIELQGRPRVAYVANRVIRNGEELFMDYGDRRKHTIRLFPWLKE
ncbi:hypothetical protein ACOME3_006188 [Neoechinorhynchus agilis]